MAEIPEKYEELLLKIEGGYVNNKHDHGGATKWGVTQKIYSYYFPKDGDVRNITQEQWKQIVGSYWRNAGCALIHHQGVAVMTADWFWGSGSAAIRRIQRHFGLAVDGVCGPQTANSLNANDVSGMINMLHDLRQQHFEDIVKAEPDQRVFLDGWLNRLHRITVFAHTLGITI
jgi:lysozyme family protein